MADESLANLDATLQKGKVAVSGSNHRKIFNEDGVIREGERNSLNSLALATKEVGIAKA